MLFISFLHVHYTAAAAGACRSIGTRLRNHQTVEAEVGLVKIGDTAAGVFEAAHAITVRVVRYIIAVLEVIGVIEQIGQIRLHFYISFSFAYWLVSRVLCVLIITQDRRVHVILMVQA